MSFAYNHIVMSAASAALLTLASCTGDGTQPSTPGTYLSSDKPRDVAPEISEADLVASSRGNREFAFDLYRNLAASGDNLLFSPYSISVALAMTYGGARNQTEADMAATLGYVLGQEGTHQAFNSLDLALESRGDGAAGHNGEGFQLNVVNRTWGRVGYEFLDEYLDLLAIHYGAGMQLMDFENAAEASRVEINDWVADQTADRIQDLIPVGAITPYTALILTNAVYFSGAWANPFDAARTAPATFTVADGSSVTVDTMNGEFEAPAVAGDSFDAVEIPYDGGELGMVIVVPHDDFARFESSLTAESVDAIVSALGQRLVTLSLPKFGFTADFSLTDVLTEMGMGVAMSGAADFSGMNGRGGLAISDILHKAFIGVDEAGTEAAAATAVIVGETSVPTPIEVTVNKPFVFFIRDRATNTVLFLGRVTDPTT